MLAISTEKVNDPRETGIVPGTEGLKLIIFRRGGGPSPAADTLELTSWKITFNVPSFDCAKIGASRNARSLFFDIRYPLEERFYHEM